MSSKSRRKGARGEHEIVKILTEAGIDAEKISRSGYDGLDVETLGRQAEVRRRETVPTTFYNWLEENEDSEFLFVRRSRKPWLVVMEVEDFIKLVHELSGMKIEEPGREAI